MTDSSADDKSAAAVTRMELTISTLLRGGILLSLSIVLVGVVLMFAHHPEYFHSRQTLNYLESGKHEFPTSLRSIGEGVMQGQGRAVVMLGVLVLFLTPLVRVAASVITFAIEKDWTFTAITTVVLCFMILSLVLGKAG